MKKINCNKKVKIVNKISNKLRILLVEDNLIAQTINKDALEKAGYIVEATETGKETLDKTARNCYSLIFMDIDLPGIAIE